MVVNHQILEKPMFLLRREENSVFVFFTYSMSVRPNVLPKLIRKYRDNQSWESTCTRKNVKKFGHFGEMI